MAVYVLRTWKIKPGTWREFQDLSSNDIWPAMEAAGAKIIGLWQTIIGEGNEVVLLTRYDDLAMWERTRTWTRPAPDGVDPQVWQRAAQAVAERQQLTESTHARVLAPSEYRAP
jgi:hypothetical protein